MRKEVNVGEQSKRGKQAELFKQLPHKVKEWQRSKAGSIFVGSHKEKITGWVGYVIEDPASMQKEDGFHRYLFVTPEEVFVGEYQDPLAEMEAKMTFDPSSDVSIIEQPDAFIRHIKDHLEVVLSSNPDRVQDWDGLEEVVDRTQAYIFTQGKKQQKSEREHPKN